MSFIQDHTEVESIAFSADPQPDNPFGAVATVFTQLRIASADDTERRRVAALTAAIERELRALRPFLTRVIWHTV